MLFYLYIVNFMGCSVVYIYWLAEAAVTLCKNKKITILVLIPTLNLTVALILMLILTQTQNLAQTLNNNFQNIKE